jgi:hypothetical protein
MCVCIVCVYVCVYAVVSSRVCILQVDFDRWILIGWIGGFCQLPRCLCVCILQVGTRLGGVCVSRASSASS